MTDLTTVGKRLAFARSQKGFSQVEVAEALGLKNSVQVSQWESDLFVPRANRLQQIAKVLGTTTEWLISGTGKAPDSDSAPRETRSGSSEQPIPFGTDAIATVAERDYIVGRVNQAAHRLQIRRAQRASDGEIAALRRDLATWIENGLEAGTRDPELRAWLVAQFVETFDRPPMRAGVSAPPGAEKNRGKS